MAKPSVLVCDDEEGIRAALRLILEPYYELRFAVNGEEALQHFADRPADLVLLDIKMPKIDGLEVLQQLMANPAPPRVLMLTAYKSLELAQRATALGALDYVTKPFDRVAVRDAVQRGLNCPPPQTRSRHSAPETE